MQSFLALVVFGIGASHDLGMLSLILAFATYFIASYVGRGGARLEAKNKDNRAKDISEAEAKMSVNPFFLFLRSFNSDQPTAERWTTKKVDGFRLQSCARVGSGLRARCR